MKKHIFLTGEIQVGKSTAIRRYLDINGIRADGFLTRFASRGQERELFIYRFDTELGESDGKRAVKMNWPEFEVFPDIFDVHGAEIIRTSGRHGLIIMDELGVFEERAPEFMTAVFEKLDDDTPVLGVIKKRESPFLDAVRVHPEVEIFEVTERNRDEMPGKLEERLDI